MSEVAHIVTLVSTTTLCGVPARPGMNPRPLILGAPLITRHPVCDACQQERDAQREDRT